MSWKSVIQELGCYVMSSKPHQIQGLVTCDTRDTCLLCVSQATERRRCYLIHAPSDQPSRAYWGDLACVMNVIFSEPTRRLLARAVCHNPSKQITRQGPCWRKRNRLRVTLRSQARDAEDVTWGWLAETGDHQGVLLMTYEYEMKRYNNK